MNYIFDFDGTLMDTASVILATMQATVQELGLPQLSEVKCRESIGLRLEEIPDFIYPDKKGIGPLYAATYRRLFPLYNQPGAAKPFPAVIDTIRSLAAKGARMAIASSRSRNSLQEFTDEMGITSLFDMLVGGDNVKNGKPDPEPVLRILDELAWKPEYTLVVGDADVDIKMGKCAGCRTCAVTYGNGSLESLKKTSPDFIIDSFDEIIR